MPTALALVVITAVVVVNGLALWRAARNQHKYWFVILIIASVFGGAGVLGLLDIAYLVLVDKEMMKTCKTYWTKMKEAEAEVKETPKVEVKPVEKPENKA